MYIDELCDARKELFSIKEDLVTAYNLMKDCYQRGNKVLICGNGGSSADSAHIMGELMKSFKKKRPISDEFERELKKPVEDYMDKNKLGDANTVITEMKENLEVGLPTIDITSFVALNTAFSNDRDEKYVYANVVLSLGVKDDVLIAISTSGNSQNVVNACFVAKAKDMKVIALTGFDGGKIKDIVDVSITVPLRETYLIQEEHIAIYHALCLDLENSFF